MASYEDVEAIPQDDGPNPVVPIAYPAEYSRLMSYFRAFLKSGERSPRVLELTADLLEHNAAHYTVWHVRRRVGSVELRESLLADDRRTIAGVC